MRNLAAVLAVVSMIGAGAFAAQAENPATDDSGRMAPGQTAPAVNPAYEKRADPPMVKTGDQRDAVNAEDEKRPESYPADNSGRNARDANDAAVTAGDQSNAPADVEITQAIRRAVTSDDSMSVNARNVKIITAGGVVTLRGPVSNEQERASIAAKAQAVTGVTRVNNQLEVAAQ